MKNMLKGKNLLILALVGGGAYWYWNKMKQDKAKKGGSMNFTGDLDLIDYQNAAGKVPRRGIRYGSDFNRATDISGTQYYVPSNVNAAGKVPRRGIRYGSQFNRAKDVSGVEYYVPNVSANGEPFVNAASGVKIVPRYGTTFAQSTFAAQNQNVPSWATAGPKR